MIGQQKLVILWACMLLMTALCPGVHSKRKDKFKKGKGDDDDELDKKVKPSPSKSSYKQSSSKGSSSKGSSKQSSSKLGLKLAGAAAAGAVGGAAIGYGLGSLGKTKQRYGHGYGYDRSGGGQQQVYQRDGQGIHNLSNKRLFRSAAATGPMSSIFNTLGPIVPFLIGAWIRGI